MESTPTPETAFLSSCQLSAGNINVLADNQLRVDVGRLTRFQLLELLHLSFDVQQMAAGRCACAGTGCASACELLSLKAKTNHVNVDKASSE